MDTCQRKESFNPSGFTNGHFPPPKSPKSRRRTYGLSYSSIGSTPTSSIGSASELQFPIVDPRSPPSPEPLGPRPSSPLKWRSKSSVSPVEDTHVVRGTRPVDPGFQGLTGSRNPSFSEYVTVNSSQKVLFEDVKDNDTAEPDVIMFNQSSVGLRLEALVADIDRAEMSRTILPVGTSTLDVDSRDYSFAHDLQAPPIGKIVPKVESVELSHLARRRGIRSRPSVSFINPFPAWLNGVSGDDGELDGYSPSLSSGRDVDGPITSVPSSPRVRDQPVFSSGNESTAYIRNSSEDVLDRNKTGLPTTAIDGAQPSGASTDDESYLSGRMDLHSASQHSASRSFRSFPLSKILGKSEPAELWKLQASYDYSDDEHNIHLAGHKARSMSLPVISGPASRGNAAGDNPNLDNFSGQNLQHRRKGGCYLCHKGNRITEKEACLVCNAKYCYSCVLTAMESMPEGRKCRTCIGKPVDERKRLFIGKPSRLLNRLLDPQEVQQIMKAEKECAANQLRPEQLYVNGRQLTSEELVPLLECANPPPKLKPGRYWYDSQSGLWGKEGERPDKLITPDLKVGGPLQKNASNGTTQVFMNGRELGKLELKMLKWAGVHCPPTTHLWVEPNGSYQEEGQKDSKGNIWKKTSTRLLYPFFSLPTPGASSRFTRDIQHDSPDIYMPGFVTQNKQQKILVLGHEGSGRSTLFKQTKFLFNGGFSREERRQMKSMIQYHSYKYISILMEGRERFEEEEAATNSPNVYFLDDRLKHRADWFLEMMAEGSLQACFSASGIEVPLLVDELWRDPAIKATYQRKDELRALPDVAAYFLDKIVEISSNEYEPSDEDILRSEGLAQGSGLAEVEFSLDDKMPFYQDLEVSTPSRYRLIKVGGNGMSEGCKWLDMFEDVHVVVFCLAISEYDEVSTDSDGVTRSKVRQKDLFDSVLKHPILGEKPMVLLLNKYDLFEDKICKGIPLKSCDWFSDFEPVGASHYTAQIQAQQGYTYAVHKYKELFASSGHKLFTFKLNAIQRDEVLEAFHYVREILKWKDGWDLIPEESSYSTDMSSYA